MASNDFFTPLPHRLITVTGEDAVDFLHGQLSSDVKGLVPEHSQLSSYNSPKGRILALPRLFRDASDVAMRLPEEIAQATQDRLRMFVLRARVTLTLTSWRGLGLAGEAARSALQGLSALPEETEQVARADDLVVVSVPGAMPRFEVWGPPERIDTLGPELGAAGLIPATPERWEYEEIRAGLPEVYAATREAFVPQMVNLHRLGGVSFTKGCYPGQEVVARMHYLSKLKRRMFHAWSPALSVAAGETIRNGEGQTQGRVVRAAPAPEGGTALLAVLSLGAVDTGAPLLLPGGEPLSLRELPYPMDDRA